MTYVTTNLHVDLAGYRALLEKINFGKKDVLYVLGDAADYGEDAAELLTEMSMSENVYPVAGEHDLLALRMLTGFDRMLRDGTMPDADFSAEMTAWAADGGSATLAGFRALDEDMREGLLDYLSEFALYEEVEAGGRDYVLAHAGIGHFDPEKDLADYEPEDFFTPAKPGDRFYTDRVLVVGHAPTASGRIEKTDGVIFLGNGAAGQGIACLCLESGEEFYV